MSKHTPGPWRYWRCKDGSFDDRNDYAQIASGKTHVAQVRIVSTTEADLRLMVNAPKLLEALKDLLYQAKFSENEGGWDFEQATAAIAKAEGSE
jgi:hypothetical protein